MIGAWLHHGSVVDPGPETCIETLLEGIGGAPERLLLTHIHLDHAGAAGALVERFPDLEVCVHEKGAKHLADPSRLLASAERLYGDRMEELWGRVAPVPEANLHVLSGGETLAGGVEVHYTPGHASHHVAYLIDGVAYAGDVAGVVIGGSGYLLMPTPPPDIDIEAWSRSIALLEDLAPAAIRITHFGEIAASPAEHLKRARERLREWAELARELDRGDFVAQVRERIATDAPGDAEAYEQAAPPDQLYAGLDRYWQKVAV